MSSLHKLPTSQAETPAPRVESTASTYPFEDMDARTVALVIIALGVTIFLLQHMQALLAPLAFGLLLFYALDPVVDAMERARLPRWIGAALALGLTLGTLAGGAYALQDEAMKVINELPTGARRVVALWRRHPSADPGPLE